MAEDDNKIEFEISMRDSMTPVLRGIQDSLDGIIKTFDKASSSGTGAIGKVAQQTYQLHERVKQTTESVSGMSGLLGGISSRLLGPASIAFGVSQVFKELEKFAIAQAQARNFAQDTGFTVRALNDVRVQFLRAGADRVEADQTLGKFAKTFDDLIAKQTSSTFFQQYYRYNQQGAIDLLNLVNQGKRWEALQVIRDDYMRNPEGGRYRAQLEVLFGIETSLWPILNDNLEHAQKFWVPSISVIDDYLKKLSVWKARWSNIWTEVSERAVAATEPDPVRRKSFFDAIRKQSGKTYQSLPGANFPGGLSAPGQSQDTKEESNKVIHDIYDYFKKWWDTPKPTPRQEGGPVMAGRDYLVGEGGPELFGSGGEYSLVGEGGTQVIRPKKPGMIEKLEAKSAATSLGMAGMGIALKKLAPGIWGHILGVMSVDEDNQWRTAARKFLGIEDPGEIPPFKPGGAWDQRTAMFGAGGAFNLEGEGGPERISEAGTTTELSALRTKDWRRSSEVEDERSFEGVFGVPDIDLPGQGKGGEGFGFHGDVGVGGNYRLGRRHGGLPMGQPMRDAIPTDVDWQSMRDQMDRQGSPGGSSLKGELRFENVPPGVSVSTETEGFDSFTEHINRQLVR